MRYPDGRSTHVARLLIASLLSSSLLAAAPLGAQANDPLGGYVRQAIEGNLGLRQERLAADRAEAEVREARGLFLPTVAFDARYSEMSGGMNIGDLVNPAYGALNELTGSDRFPTGVAKPKQERDFLREAPLRNLLVHCTLAPTEGSRRQNRGAGFMPWIPPRRG